MDMEAAFTILQQEHFLIESSPHSAQFQSLTGCLLRLFSESSVIPGLSEPEVRLYSLLACLHDIGKRAIPPKILNKPGKLTRQEYDLMKSHTTQGCELLRQVPELRSCEAFPLLCDVCRHHHERWDGGGYPDGLAGAGITPWVQVVGLADAFDALRHMRPYKPAYSPDQAASMITSGACGTFAPEMTACFGWNIAAIVHTVYCGYVR